VPELGRTLIVVGVVLVVAGGLLVLGGRLGLPFGLGRLPGDIVVERDGFKLYLPIATSIVLSVLLSALLWLLRR
jgi:hypothetical protein